VNGGRGAERVRAIDFGVSCYLVSVGPGFVLIDTSFPSKREELDAELAAAGCSPGRLRLIVLTHGDVDHAGNASHLRTVHGCPVAIHRLDAEMVRSGDMGVGRKAKPDRRALAFRVIVWASGVRDRLTGSTARFDAFEPDVLLEDGQDLAPFGFDARVVALPGHSAGSIGVLSADGDLFCGDLLVNFTKPGLHFYIDDLARARESVAKLRGLGVGTVYPGHGKPFAMDRLPG
jgi:glyoxylase-like metal-dependent hydrolase (beta-lactamase superfamily II)